MRKRQEEANSALTANKPGGGSKKEEETEHARSSCSQKANYLTSE